KVDAKAGKSVENLEVIFTKPLTLTDAWHAEGDEENRIKFTFFLGKMKYQGTKVEVYQQIIESGLTGINRNYIRDVISACVEYYISSGIVTVRQSYEAIGVYETDGKLELALSDKDLSAVRGTEPWFVFRSFRTLRAGVTESLRAFAKLNDFFSEEKLAFFFGFAAVAPFSYALKSDGDFFWPLVILKGPRSTGKTALGSLFTTYLYGVQEGGPADVTSDFRLLDFITGTTFPRLVDESENAKFEGQKFSIKISTTLKEAAQKQFVGSRGNIDKTKKIYAARTPLILAGNKIDLEDPALLARTVIISTGQNDKIKTASRTEFRHSILDKVDKGFGIDLICFILSTHPSIRSIIDQIKNLKIEYPFSDARRADFYSSIYLGLSIWNEYYESKGEKFPLSNYLNMNKFISLVSGLEKLNEEESKERQTIQEFIEWMKKENDVMESYKKLKIEGGTPPPRFFELEQMIKSEFVDGKKWLYVTQPLITEYCRINPSFQSRSLSEIADILAEFYGLGKENFYNKTTKWIGGKAAKVLMIPLDGVDVIAYGKKEGEDKPPPPPKENLTDLTNPNQRPVRRENEDGIGVSGTPNHLTGDFHIHEGDSGEKLPHDDNKDVVRWLGISKNDVLSTTTNLTRDRLGPVRMVRITDEYLNSINKVKEFLTEFELHGRVDRDNGFVFVEISPFSQIAHWVNEKLSEIGFHPFESDNPNQLVLRYVEAMK
ncbi:MAG: hypothetical protein QXU18_13100, partial [Thermoplasmatales archaeon]